MATARVAYVCGDRPPEVRIFGIGPRVPGGYPTTPTPAKELSNPVTYLMAIPVEIKKGFFEPAQLLGLVVLSYLTGWATSITLLYAFRSCSVSRFLFNGPSPRRSNMSTCSRCQKFTPTILTHACIQLSWTVAWMIHT